jgi:hypothetical protein
VAIIFVFLDGVGLAPAGEHNPFASADTPALRALLGGPLTSEQAVRRPGLLLQPIDATLGVAGLPQSGTGHVALLSGVNAPALVGRHQPHFPPTALVPLLARDNIFGRVRALGAGAAFANPFTPRFWEALARRRTRRSASVIAAEGAGVRLRGLDDLAAGRAAPWDITGESLSAELPEKLTPAASGRALAALAEDHALVFFECFLPDLAGHGRLALSDTAAIERIDAMLGGLLEAADGRATLLLTSDHGNIEDRTTPVHTRNPVPLLVAGEAARHFAEVKDISGVAAGIVAAVEEGDRRQATGDRRQATGDR